METEVAWVAVIAGLVVEIAPLLVLGRKLATVAVAEDPAIGDCLPGGAVG